MVGALGQIINVVSFKHISNFELVWGCERMLHKSSIFQHAYVLPGIKASQQVGIRKNSSGKEVQITSLLPSRGHVKVLLPRTCKGPSLPSSHVRSCERSLSARSFFFLPPDVLAKRATQTVQYAFGPSNV